MSINAKLTAEEVMYIAAVIDNSPFKTRQSVITNMELAALSSPQERDFIKSCMTKLNEITDEEFNHINFLSAWSLEETKEQDER